MVQFVIEVLLPQSGGVLRLLRAAANPAANRRSNMIGRQENLPVQPEESLRLEAVKERLRFKTPSTKVSSKVVNVLAHRVGRELIAGVHRRASPDTR